MSTTQVEEPSPQARLEDVGTNGDAAEIAESPGSWEFQHAPTVEEVKELLLSLPDVWGIRQVDFWEYVQPLSQSKNFGTTTQKDYRTVWHLYFTVAGRIAMVNQAAMKNGWHVEFEPDPNVPESNPAGFVAIGHEEGERIVYRERVTIRQVKAGSSQMMVPLEIGSRTGTAWVPATGGSGAIASNRWEKVETSARGRALAAWGFGVLPGSGVASLEEMRDMNDLASSDRQASQPRQRRKVEQVSREDLMSQARNVLNEYQSVAGVSDDTVDEKVANAIKRMFNKEVKPEAGEPWNFDILKDGEIVLLRNRIQSEVDKMKMEKAEI